MYRPGRRAWYCSGECWCRRGGSTHSPGARLLALSASAAVHAFVLTAGVLRSHIFRVRSEAGGRLGLHEQRYEYAECATITHMHNLAERTYRLCTTARNQSSEVHMP